MIHLQQGRSVALAFLQILVLLLGLRSMWAAWKHAIFFLRTEKRIGGSMVRMLFDQCICSAGTLFFSANSLAMMLFGIEVAFWNNVNPYVASGVRILMFASMIHATNHLSESVRYIVTDQES